VNLAAFDGLADGALGLVFVTAIRKATVVEERAKLAESVFEVAFGDLPQANLAYPRSIGYVATAIYWNELCDRCRMSSLADGTGYLTNGQRQIGIDGVEQRRFTNARFAGNNANFAREP
jgi:hypothetical protein